MNTNQIHNFHVMGISYEKADAKLRGAYTFFDEYIDDFIAKSKAGGIDHQFVLSTCNRTEIYFFAENPTQMESIYCEQLGRNPEEFHQINFLKSGKDAINHVFRVSTGLESQILGDFEVLSQMKKAFQKFKQKKATNAILQRIVETTLQISKQIKTETSLSDGATSVSYAAVQYILRNVSNFNQKNIVLYGTGKIGRNTCENLIKHSDNKHITLINRTPEKAEKLSEKLHLTHKTVEELPEVLKTTDILIVSTGAAEPTITKEMLPRKEMLIIDLSIPENVAADVGEIADIQVINVDALSKVINETLQARKSEIPKVETIIRLKTWEFEDWLDSRKYVPAIEAFRDRLQFLQQHESKELQKKNGQILESVELSDRLIQKMTNQFAAHIMENPDSANKVIETMNQIFRLELKK